MIYLPSASELSSSTQHLFFVFSEKSLELRTRTTTSRARTRARAWYARTHNTHTHGKRYTSKGWKVTCCRRGLLRNVHKYAEVVFNTVNNGVSVLSGPLYCCKSNSREEFMLWTFERTNGNRKYVMIFRYHATLRYYYNASWVELIVKF